MQRLPGSAYPEPQTRGLKYSSLWLTFHGLQWPYLPAKAGRDRFVIGLSGWGWLDTAYVKFAPWGQNSAINRTSWPTRRSRGACCCGSRPPTRSPTGSSRGRSSSSGPRIRRLSGRIRVGGADTDDLWLRIGQWNRWDFQVGRFEGWEVFHLGMGLDQNTFERQGAVGAGDPGDLLLRPDRQSVPAGRRRRQRGCSTSIPCRFFASRRWERWGAPRADPRSATRPVAILDFGWLKLKGGVEWQSVRPPRSRSRQNETT